ncbi:MAG: LysM peptidoglycan-binding domain-containing protein [Leptospirales bacterium]|nr:LysM peptidoglycan-binding domain-containing protein [Leptospirales bacterium]
MKKIYLFAILSFFVLIPCFSACETTDIPVSEMAEAHKAVHIAKALKAGKYAPDLFKKAEDSLYDSHTACRDDKIEDAKKFAAAAKSNAEEASKISWPFLAADTLKEAQNMYAEAENLDAAKAAPDKMASAAEKIKKAESLNAESSYNLSYVESLSAMLDIEKAQSAALSRSEAVSSQIAALRKEAAAIKRDADAAPLLSDLASAEDLLNSAENNLNSKNIQTASDQTSEADEKIIALKTALQKIKKDLLASKQNAEPDATESVEDDKTAYKRTDKTERTGEKPRIYTVKYFTTEKDCLWRIAQKVYQDPSLWPRIYIANRDKIKDPDLIFPGQRLIIPEISDAVRQAKVKRTARIAQRNTKPKSDAITRTKGASKSTAGKTISGNTNRNKTENAGKSGNLTDRGKPTDKGTAGGGTSGDSGIASGSGSGNGGSASGGSGASSGGAYGSGTASGSGSGSMGRETFLPEGIFRENQ